jgi:hypothetical protein
MTSNARVNDTFVDDSNVAIESIFGQFKHVIGSDFDRYRNHVYRVFNNCLMMDNDQVNIEKYAIASVFHDIGIWTDKTFDYLEPSEYQAKLYLSEKEIKNGLKKSLL